MRHTKSVALFITVLIFLTAAFPIAALAASASTMSLTKTEGNVSIYADGKPVSARNDMRLYDGYTVETAKKSYAWINLDTQKLAELDSNSSAKIYKSGKKLTIDVNDGRLFFKVSAPLKSDESLSIRTSTMAIGIRGTCGWVDRVNGDISLVSVLEGSVTVTAKDPVTGHTSSQTVSAGETATCTTNRLPVLDEKIAITKQRLIPQGIPSFVIREIISDKTLADDIYKLTDGRLDFRGVTDVPDAPEEDTAAGNSGGYYSGSLSGAYSEWKPVEQPTTEIQFAPVATPSFEAAPMPQLTPKPTANPTAKPSAKPTPKPTAKPAPTAKPTVKPTQTPAPAPAPSPEPSLNPEPSPSQPPEYTSSPEPSSSASRTPAVWGSITVSGPPNLTDANGNTVNVTTVTINGGSEGAFAGVYENAKGQLQDAPYTRITGVYNITPASGTAPFTAMFPISGDRGIQKIELYEYGGGEVWNLISLSDSTKELGICHINGPATIAVVAVY